MFPTLDLGGSGPKLLLSFYFFFGLFLPESAVNEDPEEIVFTWL